MIFDWANFNSKILLFTSVVKFYWSRKKMAGPVTSHYFEPDNAIDLQVVSNNVYAEIWWTLICTNHVNALTRKLICERNNYWYTYNQAQKNA